VDDLSRGDTLVRPATAEATHMIDVKVSLLASAPRVLKQLSTVKLYAATSQRVARMQLIDTAVLEPGNGAFAQLRLSQPLCILRGDRIVLRGESPEITIGGGVVLDVAPIRFRRKDRDRGAFLQMLANASFDDTVFAFLAEKAMGARLRELAVRAGEPIDRVRATIDKRLAKDEVVSAGVGDDQLVTTHDNFEQFQHKLIEEVKSFFKATPHRLFMPREELRSRMGPMMAPHLFEKFLTTLSESRKLDVSRDGICLSGRKAQVSKEQQAAKEKMEKIFREAGFAPPTFSQAEEQFENSASARKMASLLIEEGTLQKISPTLAYHKDSLEVAIAKTRDFFTNSDKLGVGDLKDILGISRKHAVPLLEHFDRFGLTTRVGDHRVLKDTSRN
jgi:selenocysteine-specific elongation factor